MPSGGGEVSRRIGGVRDGFRQASRHFLPLCFLMQLLFLQRGLFGG
jgi:hypothetical protein